MTVVSGELPYTYLDIPFLFTGRGAGSVGVPWQNYNGVFAIPQPSGYLFEQAMFAQLAELRKYAEPPLETHRWWIYKGASLSSVSKEPINDPSPIGATLSPSGNTNCLNLVVDLRDSQDRIFRVMATDSMYTSGEIRTDYFQVSFSGLPSGQAGDYMFLVDPRALMFGPINDDPTQYVGASGYIDSQTLLEVSYQPYARLSRQGQHDVRDVTYETAPLFPAVIGSDGSYPTMNGDEAELHPGDNSALGAPQTSGFSPLALSSGYLRVVGDALTNQTRLYIVTGDQAPFLTSDVSERWIGKARYRNENESSYVLSTKGMAYVTPGAINVPHGVHKVVVANAECGHGGQSGLISIYPKDTSYDTTGWIDGLIGLTPSNEDIVRNKSGGIPANGNVVQASGGNVANRSVGIHVCNELFGGRNASGLVNISPFNGAALYLNTVPNVNYGGDGLIENAYFTKQPPPGVTWVWRQLYDNEKVFWRTISHMILAEGDTEAYAFHGNQWLFRSYSYQGIGPVDPWTWTGSTAGLGQSQNYHFMKIDTQTHVVDYVKCGYSHFTKNGEYGMNGIAWSRDYGWWGVGGSSLDGHKFESFRITGNPDGGSLFTSNGGSIRIVQPIGIGDYSFARRPTDITAANLIMFKMKFGASQGYSTVLETVYTVTTTGNVPFSDGDIVTANIFIGHTMFIGVNSEGITPGDWVVVSTNLGRFLCRVELDTIANEIQIVECLFKIEQNTVTPEIFLSL
jgi:hypothetical protein